MKRTWIVVALLVGVLWAPTLAEDDGLTTGGDLSVWFVTNASTNLLEGRVGIPVSDDVDVGLLAAWLTEDIAGRDWLAGGLLKWTVNPLASVAVSDWLPGGIGELLGLPESLTAETYVLGKFVGFEADGHFQFGGSAGPGVQVGPVVIEYMYAVIEGGDTGDPMLSSGAELYAGVCFEF